MAEEEDRGTIQYVSSDHTGMSSPVVTQNVGKMPLMIPWTIMVSLTGTLWRMPLVFNITTGFEFNMSKHQVTPTQLPVDS